MSSAEVAGVVDAAITTDTPNAPSTRLVPRTRISPTFDPDDFLPKRNPAKSCNAGAVACRDAVVVGAGHNGLVAACCLARAGRDVVVLEASDRPGGGSRTEETAGHRFDMHSVAHNIINMTVIPGQLDLAGAGLVYQGMDPFSVAVFADGRRVRFHRSVEATVDSIADPYGPHRPVRASSHRRGPPLHQRLPPYPNSRAGDWNGLQSFVDRLDDLVVGWAASEARRLPDLLPLYAFTTSAIDDTLAPSGHHTVYLACPAAPSLIRGGWPAHREEFVERCLETVEDRAPGFRASIVGVATHTPDEMERAGRWPGAHPMYLDLALDQLGPFRPTRRLGRHRTPVQGLYLSGAGTGPTGGIAGTPGRAAAMALLADVSPS